MTCRKFPLYLLLSALAGCGADSESTASRGEALFNDICANCHKESGKGNFIAGIPSAVNTRLDKEQVVQLITEGLPSHPGMPVFENLSREEAALVTDYLQTLAPQQ